MDIVLRFCVNNLAGAQRGQRGQHAADQRRVTVTKLVPGPPQKIRAGRLSIPARRAVYPGSLIIKLATTTEVLGKGYQIPGIELDKRTVLSIDPGMQ
jgi:hypothetical protein